jgi:hypothetical protein
MEDDEDMHDMSIVSQQSDPDYTPRAEAEEVDDADEDTLVPKKRAKRPVFASPSPVRLREREREGDRQTERQTDRKRQRWKERDTDTDTDTETQRHRDNRENEIA